MDKSQAQNGAQAIRRSTKASAHENQLCRSRRGGNGERLPTAFVRRRSSSPGASAADLPEQRSWLRSWTRLSRNAAFLTTLRDSGVEFVAADLAEANTMTVGVMAVVAHHSTRRPRLRNSGPSVDIRSLLSVLADMPRYDAACSVE